MIAETPKEKTVCAWEEQAIRYRNFRQSPTTTRKMALEKREDKR